MLTRGFERLNQRRRASVCGFLAVGAELSVRPAMLKIRWRGPASDTIKEL
jgi:hypothetical protein